MKKLIIIALCFVLCGCGKILKDIDDLPAKVRFGYVKSFKDGFIAGWVEKENGSDLSESFFRASKDYAKWIEEINK